MPPLVPLLVLLVPLVAMVLGLSRPWQGAREWLATAWPFRAVVFPGRPPTPWPVWEKLPWRDEAVPRIGADATSIVLSLIHI